GRDYGGGDGRDHGLMAIPEADLETIRRWAAVRIPVEHQDQVRLEAEVTDQAVTIVERRAPWHPDMGPEWTRSPVARLRYTASRGEWSLYWRDANGRFHRYNRFAPTPDSATQLAEIARDPTAIFWG